VYLLDHSVFELSASVLSGMMALFRRYDGSVKNESKRRNFVGAFALHLGLRQRNRGRRPQRVVRKLRHDWLPKLHGA
jgi:hypothetical protein